MKTTQNSLKTLKPNYFLKPQEAHATDVASFLAWSWVVTAAFALVSACFPGEAHEYLGLSGLSKHKTIPAQSKGSEQQGTRDKCQMFCRTIL